MHEEQDGKYKFNISEQLEDLRREREALNWEGSFRDYFELVAQNPRLAQLSHARVNDMIHAAGIDSAYEPDVYVYRQGWNAPVKARATKPHATTSSPTNSTASKNRSRASSNISNRRRSDSKCASASCF